VLNVAPAFSGCAQTEEPVPAPLVAIEKKQEAYSDVAVMRVIPRRFVQIASSSAGTPQLPVSANIQIAVDHANAVFRGAGIQFAVASVENIAMLTVYKYMQQPLSWSAVQADFNAVFGPTITSWSTLTYTGGTWLTYASLSVRVARQNNRVDWPTSKIRMGRKGSGR
jgi:hypothetical protein